jgi:hypothetical protein
VGRECVSVVSAGGSFGGIPELFYQSRFRGRNPNERPNGPRGMKCSTSACLLYYPAQARPLMKGFSWPPPPKATHPA